MTNTTLSPAEAASPTVLVVDDSAVMLEATSLTLEDAGYRVVTLDNPLILPSVVRQEHPDLILLDVNMPMIRGEDVAAIIRRMGVDVSKCVVLFSDARDLDAVTARAGAAGFIPKSSSPEELSAAVARFLARAGTGRFTA